MQRRVAGLAGSLLWLIGVGAGCAFASPALRPLELQTVSSLHPTLNHPVDVLITKSGDVLVSISTDLFMKDGCPSPSEKVGVQALRPVNGRYENLCQGQGSKLINLPSSSLSEPVTQVFGMNFFPGSQIALAAAIERQGVDFVSLVNRYTCRAEGVVNVPQAPKSQSCRGAPGSFDLAFTPDGQFAFVANEYGTLPSAPHIAGTVGVIKIHRDSRGFFDRGTHQLPVSHWDGAYINIPGGRTIAGVTMSHDGKRLYVTSETAEDGFEDPTGGHNPKLTKRDCVQGRPQPKTYNGLLSVIDVEKARAGYGRLSIIRTIASGCSPVRIVESADGRIVWVAARGDNRILGFDVKALLSDYPNTSLVGDAHSGGTAPVGVALFSRDRLLAVANSNRFDVRDGVASVAFIDVREPARAAVIKRLALQNRKSFPRNVKAGPDDSTIYVTHYNDNKLQVIKTTVR